MHCMQAGMCPLGSRPGPATIVTEVSGQYAMTTVKGQAEAEAHHWKLFLQWPSSSSGAIRHVYLHGSIKRPVQCCLLNLLNACPRP